MRSPIIKRASLLLLLLLPFAGLRAQGTVKDQVVAAIGTGNSAALARHLVANVDMSLPNASDYYSKAQAEQILRKFFEEHPPRGLTIVHEGANRGGDSYYIGNLATAKGDFRVTFFLKKNGDVFQVKQLRLEAGRKDP
ncbi:MAG: DUF4783 domain-containing protein [Flavobacteriales bacterium]|nr:DUF4783 domain-containing protein [Flavobacteriales bacterium]